ncbi:MAG: helix-turn-helix transcriptional regulator [Planctomycetaceae bacterium]|jgi:ribosome-binding protein aMBF1 (putative translation factor)|nr:helix-turn-helix transcriptional regulator [Planctomycetaceae bacterium]MBV8316448.1 helix-turn-helix transcriptional regulator [Planctomycetaceae bacterium]
MSGVKRTFRKIERTPEEQAELKAEREMFQRDRPTLEDLIASGEYDGPYRHGDILDLLMTVARLKRERERRGLSLADVTERSGMDKGMLSRLENGKILNPTLGTLWRYAEAIGARIKLEAELAETLR